AAAAQPAAPAPARAREAGVLAGSAGPAAADPACRLRRRDPRCIAARPRPGRPRDSLRALRSTGDGAPEGGAAGRLQLFRAVRGIAHRLGARAAIALVARAKEAAGVAVERIGLET